MYTPANDSISFGSIRSSSLLGNPNTLTFNEADNNSQYDLTNSLMFRFPGPTPSMSTKIEIVCLLQAAEIERLTFNLEQYRQRYKEFSKINLDRHSYEIQIKELTEITEQQRVEKNKMKDFFAKKNDELENNSMNAAQLQKKYYKSLKQIESMYNDNFRLQNQNNELKEELEKMKMKTEAFERERIKQLQEMRLRQDNRNEEIIYELDRISHQKNIIDNVLHLEKQSNSKLQHENQNIRREAQKLSQSIFQVENKLKSFESLHEEKIKFANEQIQRLNNRLKEKINQGNHFQTEYLTLQNQLKALLNENQILKRNQMEFQHFIQQKQAQFQNQSEKFKKDFTTKNMQFLQTHNEKIVVASCEIERLNLVILEKLNELTSLEARKQKINEQNIMIKEKLESCVKEFQKQRQKSTYFEEELHNTNNLLQMKESEHHGITQALSKSEYAFTREIEEIRSQNQFFQRELENQKKENMMKEQEIFHIKSENDRKRREFQNEQKRLDDELSDVKQNRDSHHFTLRVQNDKLNQDLQILRKKLEDIFAQEKAAILIKNQSIRQNLQELRQKHQHEMAALKDQLKQKDIKIRQVNLSCKEMEALYNVAKAKITNYQRSPQKNQDSSFNILMTEIERMHEAVIAKNNQNAHLQKDVLKLQQLAKQLQQQTLQLKQVIINLSSQENNRNLSRIDDQNLLLNQLKNYKMETCKEIQKIHSITTLIHREFQASLPQNQSQNQCISVDQLLKSKEMEIQHLKQQMENLKDEMMKQNSKSEVKEMLTKIIVITKENAELRNLVKEKNENGEGKMKAMLLEKEELNRSIDQLNRTITEMKQLIHQLESAVHSEKNIHVELQSTIIHCEEKDEQKTIAMQQLQASIKHLEEQLHSKLVENESLKNEHQNVVYELQGLQNQLISAGQNILQLSDANKHLHQSIAQLNQQNTHLHSIESKYREIALNYEKISQENRHLRLEYANHREILENYTTKIAILTDQFERLEHIINILKNQNLELKNVNYDITIEIQKSKITTHKIRILNEEIDRLSRKNIDLTEEIHICRLEISEESLLFRQNKENLSLFVLLFVEIEALRIRLDEKQKEADQLRKNNLSRKAF